MDKKYSVFQIVIFGIFAFFIVIAVFIFAGLGGSGGGQDVGTVKVWGTFGQDLMDEYLTQLNEHDKLASNVKYTNFGEKEFQTELVEALASGYGPDLFLLEQSYILRHWDKVEPISYDSLSRRAFMDAFIGESELFLSKSGIIGMPFTIDPMVMYWNRDIFAEKGFAKPPKYWDELVFMSEKITERDDKGNIALSTIAFGTYDNVTHAKDILATLIMQKGGSIIGRTEGGILYSALNPQGVSFDGGISPAQAAVRSYTEFANPVKTIYTWNRSLPESIDMFAQGKLAIYIGYAGELGEIQARNPNLNFDVAVIPQIRSGEHRQIMTFGKMYAFAIPRQAHNKYGAAVVAFFLSDPFASSFFTRLHNTLSPRRDALANEQEDVLQEIFRSSALISAAWLDPYPEKTDKIFENMVEFVISGRMRFSEAVSQAHKEFRILIQQ